MRSISVVAPVCDEVGSLEQLHRELAETAAAREYDLQLILVDDGSRDGSWLMIERLAERDPRVQGIRFRRNFGKAAALAAGFEAAHGDVVVTIDSDLQDVPAEIPKLVAALDEGADVVCGWKIRRQDPWRKRFPSRVFNWLVSRVTGLQLHDHNCGLKCLRRDVTQEIRLYGELHRFIPALAAACGFRVGEVAVDHRPRRLGRSKYGWTRMPKGFLDLLTVKFLTRFGGRPLHWLGAVGLAALAPALFGIIYVMARATWSDWEGAVFDPTGSPVFFASLALLVVAAQFLAAGFVAEAVAASSGRDRDYYAIAEFAPPHEAPAADDATIMATPAAKSRAAGPHWRVAAQSPPREQDAR